MKFSLKNTWLIIKQSFSDFIDNKVFKLSAALAFYTIFSLPAMLIIIVSISDVFYGRAAVEGSLFHQISDFVSPDAAMQIQQIIRGAALSNSSTFATIVGISTYYLVQQVCLAKYRIHQFHLEIKSQTRKGRGFLKLVINRLLSFSIVVSLGFLLLVSLMVNGLMAALIDRLTEMFPHLTVIMVYVFNVI
ncbi:MAG: YhjD/YihY/BrkB family envelope integrity protein [Ferruginibacter sp.]